MPVEVCNYIRNIGAGGKFVVMLSESGPDDGLLVLSDFSRDFQHHDIVMRWQGLTGKTVASAGLRMAGGGWWKYEGDTLVLYGQSAAYGRFDPDWLRSRLSPGMVGAETKMDVR